MEEAYIRKATEEEAEQIDRLSGAVLRGLREVSDASTAANVLVVALARLVVKQAKAGKLEMALDATVEGIRAQVALFQREDENRPAQ